MADVLIIDDDASICELLEIVLTDEGHEVRSANSMARALDLIREQAPDVILFDMTLADGEGGDFVARYRQLPEATARLIAVSGIDRLDTEANRIGADAALKKPFELDELLILVSVPED